MGPKISVIVPVYNAEAYLRRCIDSIRAQRFEDFELLLVDDGSMDRSGAICDEYAARDNRIRVVHKPNTGVSDARNRALEQASGDYVIFMDADDCWSTETALQQLYEIAESKNLDLVRGEYTAVDAEGRPVFSRPVSRQRMKYADRIIGSYEFLEHAVHGEFFMWLMLIRRDIIGALRFETDRVFLEDMQFLSKLMARPRRCMYRPEIRFYAYRIYPTSASNLFLPQRIGDILVISDELGTLSERLETGPLKKYFAGRSVWLFYLSLSYLSLDEYYPNAKELMDRYSIARTQRRARKRMFEHRQIAWAPVCCLPVGWGVRLLRLRLMLARRRHAFLTRIRERFPFRRMFSASR